MWVLDRIRKLKEEAKQLDIDTSSEELLCASLGEEGSELRVLLRKVKAASRPWPNYVGTRLAHLSGNVNLAGQTCTSQVYNARRKLLRLDLPQIAEDAALRFIRSSVYEGMELAFGNDIRLGSLRQSGDDIIGVAS